MERWRDDLPDTAPEVIEEEETRETVKPERLDGQRIVMCAVPFFGGGGLVAAAFLVTSNEALKIIALLGGIALMLAAFVGAITKGFKVEASKKRLRVDGEIPRGHVKTTVKTTKVTRLSVSKSLVEGRAPPKQGIMPPVAGHMPPKEQAGLNSSGADADEDGSSAERGRRDPAQVRPEGTSQDHPSSATP
ncbi:MAG TPA: hypothetical protein VIH71_02620 [Solirubrobacteraceae bacterium]